MKTSLTIFFCFALFSLSAQNVGIGIANPSAGLHINSAAGVDPLRLQMNGSTRLRFFSNGAVSMGSNWGSPLAGVFRINMGKTFMGFSSGHSPQERLEIDGALRVGNTATLTGSLNAGTIRWNPTAGDFEGFDGSQWLTFTGYNTSTGNTNTGPPVAPMCCVEHYAGSPTGNSFFGQSVSLYGENAMATDHEEVHFYNYDGTTWTPTTVISDTYPSTQDWPWGYETAISANHAVISHYTALVDGKESAGLALVYKKVGNNWIEDAAVEEPTPATGHSFGYDVDLDSQYLVASAFPEPQNKGIVHVYKNESGFWNHFAQIMPEDLIADDFFGWQVAISGDFIAALAVPSPYTTTNVNKLYIFQRVGNMYAQVKRIDEVNYGSGFGADVAIDGNTLVIGHVRASNPQFVKSGAIQIYNYDGSDWNFKTTIFPSNGQENDFFGRKVDIKGDYIVVGNKPSSNGVASTYTYHYDGSAWQEIEIYTDPLNQGIYVGDVATDSANKMIGVPDAHVNGGTNGKVIFTAVDQ